MTRRYAPVLGAMVAMTLLFGCKDLKPIKGKGRTSVAGSAAEVPQNTANYGKSGTTGNKVKVAMYIMSKCPYGARAVIGFTPALKQIGDRIDFDLEYIADKVPEGKKCRGGRPSYKNFCSLHGPPEAKGNIIQLCVRKHYPKMSHWLAFLECQNKSWRTIPNGWEACAKQANLDVAQLKSCYEGAEGLALLDASTKKAKAAHASGSPTIYFAGKKYSGGRSGKDFLRGVCSHLTGQKPAACTKLPAVPKPIEVKAIVLNDKRCKKCKTAGLENNLRGRFFPKLTVRTVDYNTPEGKKLYADLKLKNLPVWLFEKGVEKSPKYRSIAKWMLPAGDYKKLRVPSQFDPTAEICDNGKDDTGNGKVDCADDTCKATLECRKEKKNLLEVFVMSQCPYGVKALDAMQEVLKNFGDSITFDVHYIADMPPKGKKCRRGTPPHRGFCSLHGKGEVEENIRHLCAKKYYRTKNKYMEYIWCRDKNPRSTDWQACAKQAGLDVAKIEKCSTGDEGVKLLSADVKIAQALHVGGSPTWLANNRYKFSGIAADAVKKNICSHNKGLKNCDKKLSNSKKVSGSCK